MKNDSTLKLALPGLMLGLALAYCGPLSTALPAQSDQSSRSGVSRGMDQAIRLYHDGQDTEAMDRFMDILVKGTPSEKALANEYISKITLRMNTGVNTVKDKGAEPNTLNEVSTTRENPEPRQQARPAAKPEPVDEEDADRAEMDDAQAQKDRVNDKISAKIAQMRRDLLLELGRTNAVKVYMGDTMPKAISLDPNYFFSADATFRPGAEKLLNSVAGLIFTLGKTNCLLLPEGSAEGDVKIKSIRRAIAINSFFETRGVSKSRLDVNLTGADIRFPKELTNISGIIIIFDYDKAPRLKDTADLQTRGPRVSLGVYPTAISVQNNEGAIVEFSVFESPVSQPSWKFQIFEVQKDGSRLQLQEISGSGPQYNQSYWNGRKKFFGAAYPSGKYMFTVTASDSEGRDTTLSRLLLIRPSAAEEAAQTKAASLKAAQKETVTAAGLKTKTLAKGAGMQSGKVMKGKAAALKKAKAKAAKKGAKARKAAVSADEADGGDEAAPAPVKAKAKARTAAKAKKKAAPAAAEDGGGETPAGAAKPADDGSASGDAAGQVSYKIYFKENTATLTANSEKRLAQVAETLSYYPMSNISLTGYAYSGEPSADTMAEDRANYVATRLAEKYKIDKSRMEVKSAVSETPKSIVEIKLTGKEKE
jgi:outer membrane protein OmpA-like peptidoglycan-associated protein